MKISPAVYPHPGVNIGDVYKEKTGGSAFPLPMGSETTQGSEGMTLRDYFAAKAMQGLLANSETNRAWGVDENAKYAYKQADAMLEERER